MPSTISAQVATNFKWSENPTGFDNESEYTIKHIFDGNRLFKIKTKYNDKIYNTDVLVDIFDSKDDFEKDDTNILSVDSPFMGLKMLTIINIFPLEGKSQVQFLNEYNRDTRDNELFYQKTNIDTETKNRIKLATKMPEKNESNPGNFNMSQSENKQGYVVLKQPSYDKKVNEKITFTLLDANFKVSKEIEYEFPFSSKQSGDQSLFVSNLGNVFMIKNIDLPKMKPYMALYFWNSKENKITQKDLKLKQDNLQINQFKGQFVNDDFLLRGFYSDTARFFSMSYGESSPISGIFATKFNSIIGEMSYFTSNPIDRIKNCYLKNSIVDGSKSWLLLDLIYKEKRRMPSTTGNPLDYNYNYIYECAGINLAMVDNTTGKLDWSTIIKIQKLRLQMIMEILQVACII